LRTSATHSSAKASREYFERLPTATRSASTRFYIMTL
jgi:hypothetical protein